MPWLIRDGEVLATLEVAERFGPRARGLIGRDGLDGGLLLRPAKSVHTLLMRFPIDVAFCDRELVVLRVIRMAPYRFSRPVWRAHAILEAEAGSFERWRLAPGDKLDVKA
jgi:uncharacterized protein